MFWVRVCKSRSMSSLCLIASFLANDDLSQISLFPIGSAVDTTLKRMKSILVPM